MPRNDRSSLRTSLAVAGFFMACCHQSLAADYATGLPPCKNTFPTPGAETPSQFAAVDLLSSVTQLGSPRGKAVLTANLAIDVAINNHSSAAVRARALVDTQITDSNAFTLADGLGATMAGIYRKKAQFQSADDGRTKSCGEISPAVSSAIIAANALSGGDSNAGKFAFANGLKGTYKLPPGGTYDVIGIAYDKRAGTPGADKYGDSRPFQTAPLAAASGPHIETYDSVDFFGHKMNSRVVLTGATDTDKAAG